MNKSRYLSCNLKYRGQNPFKVTKSKNLIENGVGIAQLGFSIVPKETPQLRSSWRRNQKPSKAIERDERKLLSDPNTLSNDVLAKIYIREENGFGFPLKVSITNKHSLT